MSFKDAPTYKIRKVDYATKPSDWRIFRLDGYTDGRPSYTTLREHFYRREDAEARVDEIWEVIR